MATFDYLLIGGGGGGGSGSVNGRGAGGGGGGGVAGGTVDPGAGLTITVTIGGGASGSTSYSLSGANGGTTSATGLPSAPGGGGGGSGEGGPPGSGGSGGGAGDFGGVSQAGGAPTLGYAGGANSGSGGTGGSGGGGGGYGGAGAAGAVLGAAAPAGGAGYISGISGASVTYSAGGAGAGYTGGYNGNAGAGYGYGGGGGAGNGTGAGSLGGSGAQGVAIFRYLIGQLAGAGGTITTSGGYRIHTFTSSGTFTVGPPTLTTNAVVSFSTVVNLARGGISFATQAGVQLLSVADLSPGYRPPAFLLPSGYETLEDQAGSSVPGGLVWTYQAGTTTLAITYTDSTLTVPNTNPIICDAGGRWGAWVPIGTAYKLVFEGPATPPNHGPTIRTVDGLQILSLPTWTNNPYNVTNYTSVGGGTWTVESGDQLSYQWMLDGKRMLLSLGLTTTSIAGTVTALRVALPPGIVSAPWMQIGPCQIADNAATFVGAYYEVDASSATVLFKRNDQAALAASTNNTSVYCQAVIAIT